MKNKKRFIAILLYSMCIISIFIYSNTELTKNGYNSVGAFLKSCLLAAYFCGGILISLILPLYIKLRSKKVYNENKIYIHMINFGLLMFLSYLGGDKINVIGIIIITVLNALLLSEKDERKELSKQFKFNCSICGEPVNINDDFCKKCGAIFEEEIEIKNNDSEKSHKPGSNKNNEYQFNCSNCGAVVKDDANKCLKCGAVFIEE